MNQIDEMQIELRDDETGFGVKHFKLEETIAWTSGVTKDSAADLLPANSIIDAVGYEVRAAITGGDSTAFSIGDATTAARFGAAIAKTLGSNGVLIAHNNPANANAAGPVQAAAAKLRLTATGGTPTAPTAGSIYLVVTGRIFYAPDTI